MKAEVVDKIVDAYRLYARYPSVVSGTILKSESQNFVKIQSKWSQKNLEKKEIVKFQKNYLMNLLNDDEITFPCIDVTSEQSSRFSNSEKYSCILRESTSNKDTGKSKKKQFLEVWKNDLLYKNFDIDECDGHGTIYCDGEFGCLEWSPDESKILYIAEKKFVESQPFYKQKTQTPKSSPDELVILGDEYIYKPDWGEQLVDKHQPVVGICDIEQETLKVLEGIPCKFSPGQLIWSKNGEGVYGIILDNEPRRLGLIYCTNRKGYIFYLSLKGEFRILSGDNKSVRSPRLSSDGKYLFWLQRPADGPHDGCQELVKYDLASSKAEIVIPIIRKNLDFPGIYSRELPRRCMSQDGKRLFFSTVIKSKIVSCFVDLDTKEIKQMNMDGNASILDVHNDMILISTSSFQSTPAIKLSESLDNVKWIPVTKSKEILKGSVMKIMEFDLKDPKGNFSYFNAIYFGPQPSNGKKIPLIVSPHGGPHSCVTDNFSLEASFFVSLGFAILYINYRGSTGVGQDGIDYLLGKIGDTDVKDCHFAVNEALKEFRYLDTRKIALYGGSHGGYLVAHLSAQYPDFYKAVVARNPVIDVLTMYSLTDIPDWDSVESGFPFKESAPLTMDQATKMIKVSPIYMADSIKAPTFLMLGKKDLRVPYWQGLYLYNILKARNVRTRLNVYEDNHALQQVPVHLDSTLNSVLWFAEHLNITL